MWRHISTRSRKCLSITESNIPWCQPLCRGSASPRVGAGVAWLRRGTKWYHWVINSKQRHRRPDRLLPFLLVTTLLRALRPSSSYSLFLSPLPPPHSLLPFSFIVSLSFSTSFPLSRVPRPRKLARRKISLPLGLNPNKQNIQIIFHILFLPSRQARIIFKMPLGFVQFSTYNFLSRYF